MNEVPTVTFSKGYEEHNGPFFNNLSVKRHLLRSAVQRLVKKLQELSREAEIFIENYSTVLPRIPCKIIKPAVELQCAIVTFESSKSSFVTRDAFGSVINPGGTLESAITSSWVALENAITICNLLLLYIKLLLSADHQRCLLNICARFVHSDKCWGSASTSEWL